MARKQNEPVPTFVVGDKVLWKGIGPLTIREIRGEQIYCVSLHMQLMVDDPTVLTKVG